MRALTTVLLTFIATLAGLELLGVEKSSAGEPAVWPQWRGPSRDGLISGGDWPDGVSGSHLQRTWRAELGPSYS